MTYSVPVMEAARGETRKATRSATSDGRAGRPIGMPPSDFINPLRAVEHGKAASWRRRTSDDVDNDVDPAKAVTNRLGHDRAAFGSGDIGGDEQLGIGQLGGCGAGGGEDRGAGLA